MSEKILIVEDEMVIGLNLEMILRSEGYEVLGIASSRSEVLEYFQKASIDLVLMDVELKKEYNGLEIGLEIHKKYHTPILYITAFKEERLRKIILKSEYPYIPKPFNRNMVIQAIKKILKKKP